MPTQRWKGSSKDITYEADGTMIFDFSDRVSVFDLGPVPRAFAGLGELRCTIATRIFKKMKAAGLPTHFVDRVGTTTIMVTPFDVPETGKLFPGADGRLLPLELLFRFAVTQKFQRRIEAGEVDKAAVERFLHGPALEVGSRLNPCFVECSTKHQAADAYVSDESAAVLAGISARQLHDIYEQVREGAAFLQRLFKQSGFDLRDGKFEGALTQQGQFIFADSISPDELRLVGPDEESYDKDPVRTWYEQTHPVWTMSVQQAKKAYPNDKQKWPSYVSAPPDDIVETVISRYRAVADALVAQQ